MFQTVRRQLDLNGAWRLSGSGAVDVTDIPAIVPGNIEIDLERAGIIPDPFFGCNEKKLRPFEFNNWCYRREFTVPADFPQSAELVFDAVDTIAVYRLNGREFARSRNGFIAHRFPVGELLRRGAVNQLEVEILSPIHAAAQQPFDHACFAQWRNYESLGLRKPAHEFGWDIAPRMLLGGIWRDVRLEEVPPHRLRSCYFDTVETTPQLARVRFSFDFETSLTSWDQFELTLRWECGQDRHSQQLCSGFTQGGFLLEIPQPQLWHPAGSGNPALYRVTIECRHGAETLWIAERTVGLRTVELEYGEEPGAYRFRFKVNGRPIMIKGANHVPLDALHSRDRERTLPVLELFRELGCNMLRIWGGGVYESDEFYDCCDRNGILIWHDFMLGCALNSQREEFMDNLRQEVAQEVLRLRQHPAIALWAGDNEVDVMTVWSQSGLPPSHNRLTREVIPQVLDRLDPRRIYLPSSPWISTAMETRGEYNNTPEQHVWGPRDYFKSPFYVHHTAAFVSECGYHGAPAAASIRQFLSPDKVWPAEDNPEWITHATEGYAYRVKLMFDQIREYFGIRPATLEEFVEASQIVQAEAKKFFIENIRIHKWAKSGILWWNVIDCWPQFSDAVVDYYFRRKRAFSYIKRAQAPLLVILSEWENRGHRIVVTNDRTTPARGNVRIRDAESGELLFSGNFEVESNANAAVGEIRLPHGDQRCLKIDWQEDTGDAGHSHYITGHPPFELARYRRWSAAIESEAR